MIQTVDIDTPATAIPIIKPEGTERWPFVATTSGGVVLADTRTELCATIVDDYPVDDIGESLYVRWQFLVEVATAVQLGMLTGYDLSQDLEGLATLPETELSTILAVKSLPLQLDGPWVSPVPLVVIATDYAPFTDRPAPVGDRITVLNPHTETTFLDSLHSVGFIELWEQVEPGFYNDDDTAAAAKAA